MLGLEQVRAEILERIERLDRRSGQIELRIIRIEQRVEEMLEMLAKLELDLASRADEADAKVRC
jgi:hypothetical protein